MRPAAWSELQESRSLPIATCVVLGLTAALTLLQIVVSKIRLDLWRDEQLLNSGELWRLVTPLLIQYDAVGNAVVVLFLIAVVGTAVERVYESSRWLVIYVICGVIGQACGYLWAPPDAGASVAGAGLLGALCAWMLMPRTRTPLPPRVGAVLILLGGVALTAVRDMHGPPLLAGCALGVGLYTRT